MPEVSFAAILVSKSRAFQFPNSKTEAVDDLGPKKIPRNSKKRSILVKPHQLQGVFLANKPKRLCLICENVNFPATKICYFPRSYFFLIWKNKDHDKSVEKLDDKKQWWIERGGLLRLDILLSWPGWTISTQWSGWTISFSRKKN